MSNGGFPRAACLACGREKDVMVNGCVCDIVAASLGKAANLAVGPVSHAVSVFRTEPKASKNDQDKPDISLIPYCAQVEEARALMVGEKKYGRYNYTKGHKASQLVAAAQRHLLAWYAGETNDPVDGQSHLGSVRATMAMLIHQIELGTLNDDRFKKD